MIVKNKTSMETNRGKEEEDDSSTTSKDDMMDVDVDVKPTMMGQQNQKQSQPFMDTFWSLSSEDSHARSQAGYDMIQHCLPNNIKDASYALTRLLKGIGSGRKAARQGFASTLTCFLNVAYNSDETIMENIKKEMDHDNTSTSTHHWLHDLILQHTNWETNTKEKLKPMEERDCAFGRLFAIAAVARSGCLQRDDVPSEIVQMYLEDLIYLYQWRKWMKEVTMKCIMEYMDCITDDTQKKELIKNVIVPRLLSNDDDKSNGDLLSTLSAEQLALVLYLQQNISTSSDSYLPSVLTQPLLSKKENLQLIKPALMESSKAYPRLHIIWYQIFKQIEGNETFLDDLLTIIVEDGLLSPKHATHERKALVLLLMKELSTNSLPLEEIPLKFMERSSICKFLFNTTTSDNKQKQHKLHTLGHDVLETLVLASATTSSRIKLAKCLVKIEPRFDSRTKTKTISRLLSSYLYLQEVLDWNMYLKQQIILLQCSSNQNAAAAAAKEGKESSITSTSGSSLHEANGYLDLLTSTQHLTNLLGELSMEEQSIVIQDILSFLMTCAFVDGTNQTRKDGKKDSKKKKKKRSKSSSGEENDAEDEKHPQDPYRTTALTMMFGKKEEDKHYTIPASFRMACCGKFCSTLAFVCAATNFGATINKRRRKESVDNDDSDDDDDDDDSSSLHNKDPLSIKYNCLKQTYMGWKTLEATAGATPFASSDRNEDSKKSRSLVDEVIDVVETMMSKEKENNPKKVPFAKAMASLVIGLGLQLLQCGVDNNDTDNNDNDEEEEDDAVAVMIHDTVEDMVDAYRLLLNVNVERINEDADDEDDEPPNREGVLADLMDGLVGVISLSQSLEQQRKHCGASFKLFKDLIKTCMAQTLAYVGATVTNEEESMKFDTSKALDALLDEICVENETKEDVDDEKEIDDDDDESMEEESNDENEANIFTSKLVSKIVNDEEEEEEEEEEDDDKEEDEEEEEEKKKRAADMTSVKKDDDDTKPNDEEDDIELKSSELDDMLMNDEVDEQVLEHHAGADKALAKLIQLQKDQRKSAQKEQERQELIRRSRCVTLLELLLSQSSVTGSASSSSQLISTYDIINGLLRLCQTRNHLEKTLKKPNKKQPPKNKGGGGGADGGDSKIQMETSNLIEKISNLMKQKIWKLSKLHPMKEGEDDNDDAIRHLIDAFVTELRSSIHVKQFQYVVSSFLFVLKQLRSDSTKDYASDKLSMLLHEWASTKTTKLHSTLSEECIQTFSRSSSIDMYYYYYVLKPLLLGDEKEKGGDNEIEQQSSFSCLMDIIENGRNSYIKVEAIRLCSLLYTTTSSTSSQQQSEDGSSADDDKHNAKIQLSKQWNPLLQIISKQLEAIAGSGGGSGGAKRTRDVLKSLDGILNFNGLTNKDSSVELEDDTRTSLLQALDTLKTNHKDSGVVQNVCNKLIEKIKKKGEEDINKEASKQETDSPKSAKSQAAASSKRKADIALTTSSNQDDNKEEDDENNSDDEEGDKTKHNKKEKKKHKAKKSSSSKKKKKSKE